MSWLEKQASKLVDVNDLVLLQHCIKLSQESEWFRIDSSEVAVMMNLSSKRVSARKKRLVRDGVLNRRIRYQGNQYYWWFKLAGDDNE